MRVLVGSPDVWSLPPGGVAVSIGVFDGVHLGHRQMLDVLTAGAGSHPAGAITFDRHPLATIDPDRAPPLITTPEERLGLFEELGLDFAAILTFDDATRGSSPEQFVETILRDGLGARLVVVGEGFRFGMHAAGDVDELRRLGDHYGFAVQSVELLETDAGPVSSTLIRRAVSTGDVERAADLLGRLFARTGRVVPGERRGSQIGFPTANLDIASGLLVPAGGVYTATAQVGARPVPAVVNIGTRPTFDGLREVVEAHLLDFEADLYGQDITLQFRQRLRSEQRFESVPDLVAQIRQDVAIARERLEVDAG